MGNDHKHKSNKDSKKKSKKEHKKHKKSKRQNSDSEPEIDYSDPSLWVEKESDVPPPATSAPEEEEVKSAQPSAGPRHGWMLSDSFDFGSLGTARQPTEESKPKPDPDEIKISERELNPHLKSGLHVDQYPETKTTIQFGDAGSKWRMTKLKRVMEQAEEQQRPVEEVGLERYGSMEKFQEALAEREYLDKQRSKRRHEDGSPPKSSRRRYMFTDTTSSGDSSATEGFRRPEVRDVDVDEFGRDLKRRRQEEKEAEKRLVEAAEHPVCRTGTPVVITQHEMPKAFSGNEHIPSRDELNKLNAKVLRAKMMGAPDAEKLEQEYQVQLKLFEAAERGVAEETLQNGQAVKILPTVDSEGKLHDYALRTDTTVSTDRKGKNKERFKGTHDPRTGERLKYGTTDDNLSLMDMFRLEKAGSRISNDLNLEFANKIITDKAFENDLDYMDDKADVIASRKGLTEEQKMRYAIRDYKRTQEALDRCRYCYHDDKPPQCCMISLGTQTYLALPNVQELVPGHCQIVPLQHLTSTLECDNDAWDEIRNFQKCLLQMFNEQGCGVIFMETVMNLRQHRHTVIEAIPVPYGVYEDAPAYFKDALLSADEEWTQHRKIIETDSRGFRHSMVKDLPYFHVWFGLDSGFGHIIENEKDFPQWFGKEVIAGMLDIGPERWRRPQYHHISENRQRQQEFLKNWEKWDWTAALPS